MSKMQEAMISCWKNGFERRDDIHPLYAEAFIAAWEKCKEECSAVVMAEHIGKSLDDQSLCEGDIGYNAAIEHAIKAIENV